MRQFADALYIPLAEFALSSLIGHAERSCTLLYMARLLDQSYACILTIVSVLYSCKYHATIPASPYVTRCAYYSTVSLRDILMRCSRADRTTQSERMVKTKKEDKGRNGSLSAAALDVSSTFSGECNSEICSC